MRYFLNVSRKGSILVLPYKSMVDNVEFLFDEVEPSPVFESDEMFYNVVDKCPSFSESSTSVDGADLFIY